MEANEQFAKALREMREAPSYSTYSAVAHLASKQGQQIGLKPVHLAFLRNFTVEPLEPLIKGELASMGLQADCYFSDFDSIADTVLNSASEFNHSSFNSIFIFNWLETLSPVLGSQFLSSDPESIDREIDRVSSFFNQIFGSIRRQKKTPIFFNNFPLPVFPTLGVLDGQSLSYHTHTIIKLNQALLEIAKKHSGVYVLDLMSLFSRHGFLTSFDEKHWQMSRAPLGRDILIPLSQEIGKLMCSLEGQGKKCLVLDCDNTLWGGIVGEDGIGGIKLGKSYPGQVFLDFHQEILNLHNRGVIIALCSKNNEQDVMEVFERHEESRLKKHHFASWRINWTDKATNLESIAQELNIGLDSFVFVDDSDFECNLVRQRLPQVEVFKFEPETYKNLLKFKSKGYFDSLQFTKEDKYRNQMYASQRERAILEEQSGSLEDYLQSLKIVAEIKTIINDEVPRVAQLTQKTNQFNLTTRRYSESEIEKFKSNDSSFVFSMKLSDKVADLGLIGVGILVIEKEVATIDSFLMSCRALGRGAETALLGEIVSCAISNRCKTIQGEFIPTAKNSQVKDFYQKNGFSLISSQNGSEVWRLEIKNGLGINRPNWIEFKGV